jgi:hypothetical protein
MTEYKLLLGSLSNDLNRVANLSYRSSIQSATRFWQETKRWLTDLQNYSHPPHIAKIITTLQHTAFNPTDLAQAEQHLMYSIILQNYTLHL